MKSGLLYALIRPFAWVSIGLYFRKIHLINRPVLPQNGPLILACNHPNSFTEACILACFQPRTLHFLVRGDVFKNPIIAFLLRQTNQIPIFRFKDGFSNLKQNENTFAACYNKLKENAAILIFSEASSVFEKRLRPIQKGTARLAFGAWSTNELSEELHIQPVGINYSKGDRFRSEVSIQFGEPIPLSDFTPVFEKNAKEGIEALTGKLQSSLEELVIHIKDKSRDKLYDDCMEILESVQILNLWSPVNVQNDRFEWETRLAERINTMEDDEASHFRSSIAALKKCIPGSKKSLSRLRYLDVSVGGMQLKAILFALPALPGILYFFVPFILSKLIAIPFLRYREFYTGVRIGSILVLGILQGFSLLIIGLLMSWYTLLILLAIVPLFGWFAVQFLEYYWSARSAMLWKFSGDKRKKAINLRSDILSNLGISVTE